MENSETKKTQKKKTSVVKQDILSGHDTDLATASPTSSPVLARFVRSSSSRLPADVVLKDVNAAVATIKTKRTIQFVDW